MVCSPNGFGQMSRQYHRAIRKHLIRDPYGGRRKPVLINNWEATYFDFNADKLVDIAQEAAPWGSSCSWWTTAGSASGTTTTAVWATGR